MLAIRSRHAGRARSLLGATLVAGALLLGGCGRHARDVHAHHSIVVLGDSLTLGVGAADPNDGFVYVLYRRILADDPSAQIVNYGVRSARTVGVLREQLPRTPQSGITDVWICVGANDLFENASVDRIAADQESLAASVRARWPIAHVVFFGVLDVARSPVVPAEAKLLLHRRAGEANDPVRAAARTAHAEFVDLFQFSRRRLDAVTQVSADGFHPNERGYADIADYAKNAVIDR